MIYTVHHCICTSVMILELICAKDTNIEHEIKYDMKKMYSIERLIYVKNHKNIKGKIENTYIL